LRDEAEGETSVPIRQTSSTPRPDKN